MLFKRNTYISVTNIAMYLYLIGRIIFFCVAFQTPKFCNFFLFLLHLTVVVGKRYFLFYHIMYIMPFIRIFHGLSTCPTSYTQWIQRPNGRIVYYLYAKYTKYSMTLHIPYNMHTKKYIHTIFKWICLHKIFISTHVA